MKLKPFIVMSHNSAQQRDEKVKMLINTDHIVSVKPIKMTNTSREVIDGHWIRLTNGKKYRALQVPTCIIDCFDDNLSVITKSDDSEVSFSIQ